MAVVELPIETLDLVDVLGWNRGTCGCMKFPYISARSVISEMLYRITFSPEYLLPHTNKPKTGMAAVPYKF